MNSNKPTVELAHSLKPDKIKPVTGKDFLAEAAEILKSGDARDRDFATLAHATTKAAALVGDYPHIIPGLWVMIKALVSTDGEHIADTLPVAIDSAIAILKCPRAEQEQAATAIDFILDHAMGHLAPAQELQALRTTGALARTPEQVARIDEHFKIREALLVPTADTVNDFVRRYQGAQLKLITGKGAAL